ncbi:hypothetical protein ONZ51_g5109 [Trametes cubensis]|uniref:Uncharacterized protein n=1 Tax=Trametes cubensis TaxID=1111947 RepID=A0AAD7XCD6_9APHY|nr:hypothetical protein ONZ51_g5109 [Trametes cubensis]
MPSGKLAALDALLNETQKLLDSSVQEGLIVEERFRLLMWTTRNRIDKVRADIYNAHSLKEDLRNWRKGLSTRCTLLCEELDVIRASIARSSAEERDRLDALGRVPELVASSCSRARPLADTSSTSQVSADIDGQSADSQTDHGPHGTTISSSSGGHATPDEDSERLESLALVQKRRKRHLSQRAMLLRFGRHLSLPHRPRIAGGAVFPARLLATGNVGLSVFAKRVLHRSDDARLPYTVGDVQHRSASASLSSSLSYNDDYDGDDESDV